MIASDPLLHRTFRLTVDISTVVHVAPRETADSDSEVLRFHRTLVQQLLTHPELLDHLLRASAVEELKRAEKMLAREYGWDKLSDQRCFSQ